MSNFYGGLVTELTRLRNSATGNPRWRFTLDNGIEFETEPDAQINFVITETKHGPGHYLKFRLTSTRHIGAIEVMGTHSGPIPTRTVTNSALTDAYARALEDAAKDIVKYFDDSMELYNNGLMDQILPVDEWLLERAREVRGEES